MGVEWFVIVDKLFEVLRLILAKLEILQIAGRAAFVAQLVRAWV